MKEVFCATWQLAFSFRSDTDFQPEINVASHQNLSSDSKLKFFKLKTQNDNYDPTARKILCIYFVVTVDTQLSDPLHRVHYVAWH